LLHAGVDAVVRLKEASTYDSQVITDAEIARRDRFFPTVRAPP